MRVCTRPIANRRSEILFEATVTAHGVVHADLSVVAALREEPGVPGGRTVPPRFLRHADEQTVVGLAAVLRAVQTVDRCYDDWGVLAASQFPGRIAGAAALTRFQRGGPSTLSAHLIPQHSLHAMAGAISIAMGMHGPNFGIGGGTEALAEGLAAALSCLDPVAAPGLWLVLTGWTPEPVPDGLGSSSVDSVCHGLAMALASGAAQGPVLRLARDAAFRLQQTAEDEAETAETELSLPHLADRLSSSAWPQDRDPWSCVLPCGDRIELLPRQQGQPEAIQTWQRKAA